MYSQVIIKYVISNWTTYLRSLVSVILVDCSDEDWNFQRGLELAEMVRK